MERAGGLRASPRGVDARLEQARMPALRLTTRPAGRRQRTSRRALQSPRMKIYIAQLNPTVGALAANAELIRSAYAEGVAAGADVVLATELAVTGYPPRDLLDREIFVNAALETRDA